MWTEFKSGPRELHFADYGAHHWALLRLASRCHGTFRSALWHFKYTGGSAQSGAWTDFLRVRLPHGTPTAALAQRLHAEAATIGLSLLASSPWDHKDAYQNTAARYSQTLTDQQIDLLSVLWSRWSDGLAEVARQRDGDAAFRIQNVLESSLIDYFTSGIIGPFAQKAEAFGWPDDSLTDVDSFGHKGGLFASQSVMHNVGTHLLANSLNIRYG